ncbi:MAG TPA: hypothetical protein VHO95_11470 [Candidatus Dormibacteraeota bacterium]|nr:hypothetical protein [Candidatus Dormibacteraeota bacterium]
MIPLRLGQAIIRSRLLILQSKRLLMNSYQRRMDEGGHDSESARLAQLRTDIQSAQHQYRSAILNWESAENQDYWLTAYSHLIDTGRHVIAEMRGAAVIVPNVEHYEIAADVEALERMVQTWVDAMRRAMAAASVA